jgi:hypothetical protein
MIRTWPSSSGEARKTKTYGDEITPCACTCTAIWIIIAVTAELDQKVYPYLLVMGYHRPQIKGGGPFTIICQVSGHLQKRPPPPQIKKIFLLPYKTKPNGFDLASLYFWAQLRVFEVKFLSSLGLGLGIRENFPDRTVLRFS